MNIYEQRLAQLGIILPQLAAPVANYLPATIHNGVAYISGQLPRNEAGLVKGQVGGNISIEQGAQAARLCAIAVLAALKSALEGDLGRINRCLSISGFVNAPIGFEAHPQVINGGSDLLVEVLGDAGRHTRIAVGVASLPLGCAVEISATFAVE